MLCCVDPPEQSKGHVVMSLDLQAALGAIERGAEERLEILRDKKRQLEASDMKPQLVGHVEVDEEGELLKIQVAKNTRGAGRGHGRLWCIEAMGHTVYCIATRRKTEEEH